MINTLDIDNMQQELISLENQADDCRRKFWMAHSGYEKYLYFSELRIIKDDIKSIRFFLEKRVREIGGASD